MIEDIANDLKEAMKLKDKPKILGLRNLLGKLKEQQINKGAELEDKESIKILNSAAKQLKDSIEQYKNANRLDLLEKEKYELSLVENYLPEPISENEINLEVLKAIKENNANSMTDMGKIMGIVMSKFTGAVDGKMVQKIVRDNLNK